MKKLTTFILSVLFISTAGFAQDAPRETQQGHVNQNKFRQLKDVLATPNAQRTASGAPGKDYTQQKVDYVIDLVLDDKNQKITGSETITYHNNSADALPYLWLQLDQNKYLPDTCC